MTGKHKNNSIENNNIGGMSMINTKYYRKHPRSHAKNETQEEEKTLNLSAIAALGILAFTFANGLFLGYAIKRNRY